METLERIDRTIAIWRGEGDLVVAVRLYFLSNDLQEKGEEKEFRRGEQVLRTILIHGLLGITLNPTHLFILFLFIYFFF